MYKPFALLLGMFLGGHAPGLAQTSAPQIVLVQERAFTVMTIFPTVTAAPLPTASFLLPQNPGKSPTHFTWQFAGTYESYHSLERLPRVEKVRTLVFTQSSLPLTELWSGRLHLDAFHNTLHFQNALHVQNPRSVHLSGFSVSYQFGQGARAERPTQSWRSLFRTALN